MLHVYHTAEATSVLQQWDKIIYGFAIQDRQLDLGLAYKL